MARRRAPPRWICPLCERSVPGDEPTCYCGTRRAAVEAHARRERERTRRPFPWTLFLGELGVVAAVVYWLLVRSDAPPAPPLPVPVATPAARELPTVTASASPSPESPSTVSPARQSLPRGDEPEAALPNLPLLPASRRPSPTPSPERAEADVAREAGQRNLEQSLGRLGAEMSRLADNAQRFEAVCLGRRGDPRSCGRFQADMASASEALGRDLDQAEDDARRSWVSPGTVRDLRQRNGLDEGTLKDLAAKVRRLAVQYREGS